MHAYCAGFLASLTANAKPKAKVAFFAGCVVNYATPQLGLDVYDILAANNIQTGQLATIYSAPVACAFCTLASFTRLDSS